MRKLSTICFALILMAFYSCRENQVKETMLEEVNDPAEVRAEIERKNEMIIQYYAEGKIDSAAIHFAEDAIQMPPNMPVIRGRDAYIENWKESAQFGLWTFDLQTQEVKVCGDMAVELGAYTLDFEAKESSPIPSMSDKGNYVVLWEKRDGDWQIVWDAPVSEQPLNSPDTTQAEM